MPRPESFEDYYLRHVAIAEACGCAEMQIGRRDLDREAAGRRPSGAGGKRSPGLLNRLLARLRRGPAAPARLAEQARS